MCVYIFLLLLTSCLFGIISFSHHTVVYKGVTKKTPHYGSVLLLFVLFLLYTDVLFNVSPWYRFGCVS